MDKMIGIGNEKGLGNSGAGLIAYCPFETLAGNIVLFALHKAAVERRCRVGSARRVNAKHHVGAGQH